MMIAISIKEKIAWEWPSVTSSYAQFLVSFLSLSLFLLRHRAPPSPKGHSHQPLTLPRRALPCPLILLSLAAIVAASRIYLKYRTPIQVTVIWCYGVSVEKRANLGPAEVSLHRFLTLRHPNHQCLSWRSPFCIHLRLCWFCRIKFP